MSDTERLVKEATREYLEELKQSGETDIDAWKFL